MDYMVYKHDQLSLLDMIEVESAQFENWYSGSREIETDTKNFSVDSDQVTPAKCVTESLFDEFVRLESLRGNVMSNINVHSMETDWLEREECMNWEPHLLVNPRTGAPINGDPDDVIGSTQSSSENSYSVIPMSDSAVKKQIKEDTKTPGQPVQTFTTFTLGDAQITNSSNVALQSQLISTQPNTVQVYLQVTNAVGGMIPSDGTLCLIKMENEEDQSAQTGDNAGIQPVEDSDDAAEGNETFEKPVFSYSCLIAMALKNSDTGSLPVNEIYAYILEKFPYFRTAPDGWKNSIRHNLSLNKCFEKIENPTVNGSSRKGCLWGLNPAKVDKMDDEIAKWIKRASKSNLSVSSVGGGDGNLISSNTASLNGDLHITMQPSTPTLLSNSFWDDETDELMSSALSFGARRVLPKGTRAHVVPEKDSRQSPLVTCRSYHIKTTSAQSTSHSSVLTSPVAVFANQAAIG